MLTLILRAGAEWDLALTVISQTHFELVGTSYTRVTAKLNDPVEMRKDILARRDRVAAYAINPPQGAIKLAVFDTDSTFINQEVIDEIADFAGFKKEVSEITERAMQGELDFNAALAARVKLLKGLEVSRLDDVWRDRLSLTAGAAELVHSLKARGVAIYLLSGGFSFFTAKFSSLLGLNGHYANELEISEGVLTGRTTGETVNRQRKAVLLKELALKHGATQMQTIAVGDGANDIDMALASGLGIAFCAKKPLEEQTFAAVFERNLKFVDHLL